MVAILVLLECVLQYEKDFYFIELKESRNPCFTRMCFAIILLIIQEVKSMISRNPCFTRMCFAIRDLENYCNTELTSQSLFYQNVFCNNEGFYNFLEDIEGRNPCFTRMCFAILYTQNKVVSMNMSQSLFYQNVFCNIIMEQYFIKYYFVAILVLLECVLQFKNIISKIVTYPSRNPCFTRMCFAICQ